MVNGYQSKIIAIALSIPSIRAIFFKIFSLFKEISEGKKNLKIELTKPSTNNLSFQIYFIYNNLFSKINYLTHSHSIVPGGFEVISYVTRLIPLTLFIILVAVSLKKSWVNGK